MCNIMKSIFPLLFLPLFLMACGEKRANENWSEHRQQMEARAQTLLADSRSALKRSDFSGAKAHIEMLRRECNLALDAREEAILLLDSIEMQHAIHEMVRIDSLLQADSTRADSLRPALDEAGNRLKFYRRKLEHDKQPKDTVK